MQSPNVLIIYTDQQRADAIGAAGNTPLRTPHLDKLIARSTHFSQCYTQNPLCMPSRASFLTGRYPSTIGITHMGVPVPEDLPNIATIFGRSGYETANIGKLHFLPHANRDHTLVHPSYDFDHLEISDEPGLYNDAYRAWAKRHYPDQLDFLSPGLPPARKVWLDTMDESDDVVHPEGNRTPLGRDDFCGAFAFQGHENCTHTAWIGQRVSDFIKDRAQSSQPFMAIAGFYSPHSPWIAPQKYLDLYDPDTLPIPEDIGGKSEKDVRGATRGYYAMISEVDHWCGEILDTLEKSGQADNTIVVFTSDHGEWLGEKGRFGKGAPGDDAVTHVPLIIHDPSKKTSRQKVDSLVEALDVLPTLLDLTGIQVPSTLQGKSLLPLINGTTKSHRSSALTEFTHWRSLRTETHRYYCHADGTETLHEIVDGKEQLLSEDAPRFETTLSTHRHLLIKRALNAYAPQTRIWPY